MAVREGFSDCVKILLKHEKIDVNLQDLDGNSPLLLATRLNHIDMIKVLLARDDVDVNVPNERGWTPLGFGDGKVTEMMLQKKDVDVNCVNKKGSTPLQEGVKANDIRKVELLLKRPGK